MATLDTRNNYLETLAAASADAQSNLFMLTITGGGITSDITQALKVRCDNFTPPRTSQQGYEVKFVTAKIRRPSPKVEVNKNFTVNFRVDANYEAYKALLDQQSKTFIPTKSFTLTDIYEAARRGLLFNVIVDAIDEGLIDETPETATLFKFKNCWVSQITPLKFNPNSSTPLIVTATFNFIEMEDLQTGF